MSFLSHLFCSGRLFNAWQRCQRSILIRRDSAYKAHLDQYASAFQCFPEVLFVFQAHNSVDVINNVLGPFLHAGCKNILVFADGCHDATAHKAQKLLLSKNHFVFYANNLHEIRNYRMSLHVAKSIGCKYICLLQDDDIYSSFPLWLEQSLYWFSRDSRLAIMGLCAGSDLTASSPKRANGAFSTAEWFSRSSCGQSIYGLADFYELAESLPVASRPQASFRYAAVVNRAPQLILVDVAMKLGYFPEHLEPYQYDDFFNCFSSWLAGFRVGFMPVAPRASAKLGGMRLYNNVTLTTRPIFHARNFNAILDDFGHAWDSGQLASLVAAANKALIY